MNITQLISDLKALDLDEKATAVLATLFLTGTRPVTQIAENTDLKRPHVYNILRALQERGLAFAIKKNGILHYGPPRVQDLSDFLQRKKVEIERANDRLEVIRPLLENLVRLKGRKPQIRFFWGIDGLLSIYKETLTVRDSVIYGICDFARVFPKEADPYLNRWMWQYAKDRAAAGILYQGIVNRSPISDQAFALSKEQKRHLKVVENVLFPLEINIFDERVALMSSAQQFMGIIIEDVEISTMIRQIHQLLWAVLPDYDL